jgi:hypothetical protein
MQTKLKFCVHNDETVEMMYENGTPWGENKWADWKTGADGLTAFVDVYNKQFNFKLVKMDSTEPDVKLESAHFALYKQSNTSISGYVKNREPMTGFEDMKTVNGEVDVCGGNSGRVIDPGANGSVYFLTETYAPPNYTKLEEDIIFRISPLGVPSVISGTGVGELYETEDSYIYTLSVPNERISDTVELTIKKLVGGAFADPDKEFTFRLSVSGADENDVFSFMKNGVQQPAIRSGETFRMGKNDKVIVVVPVGTEITVSEDSDGYEPSFRLGEGTAVNDNKLSFVIYQPQTLTVTNTLSGSVPTGVSSNLAAAVIMVIVPVMAIAAILWYKRRNRHNAL